MGSAEKDHQKQMKRKSVEQLEAEAKKAKKEAKKAKKELKKAIEEAEEKLKKEAKKAKKVAEQLKKANEEVEEMLKKAEEEARKVKEEAEEKVKKAEEEAKEKVKEAKEKVKKVKEKAKEKVKKATAWTAVEVLQSSLPIPRDKAETVKSTTEGTTNACRLTPETVDKWTEYDGTSLNQTIRDFVATLDKQERRYTPVPKNTTAAANGPELDTHNCMKQHVTQRVEEMFPQLGLKAVHTSCALVTMQNSPSVNVTVPPAVVTVRPGAPGASGAAKGYGDIALVITTQDGSAQQSEQYAAVCEVKVPGKLMSEGRPVRLVRSYNGRDKRKQQTIKRAVEQLYAYMVCMHLEFGFLLCHMVGLAPAEPAQQNPVLSAFLAGRHRPVCAGSSGVARGGGNAAHCSRGQACATCPQRKQHGSWCSWRCWWSRRCRCSWWSSWWRWSSWWSWWSSWWSSWNLHGWRAGWQGKQKPEPQQCWPQWPRPQICSWRRHNRAGKQG